MVDKKTWYLQNARWLVISVIVILLDQWSKHAIQAHLSLGQQIPIFPFFNLVSWRNTGAAFSFLTNASGWQTPLLAAVTVIVSIGLSLWLLRLLPQKKWLLIAIALIIGGALGNLYDRITLGYVVDFLLFYVKTWAWPAFNIADSAICIGAAMLVIDMLRNPSGRTPKS